MSRRHLHSTMLRPIISSRSSILAVIKTNIKHSRFGKMVTAIWWYFVCESGIILFVQKLSDNNRVADITRTRTGTHTDKGSSLSGRHITQTRDTPKGTVIFFQWSSMAYYSFARLCACEAKRKETKGEKASLAMMEKLKHCVDALIENMRDRNIIKNLHNFSFNFNVAKPGEYTPPTSIVVWSGREDAQPWGYQK